MTAQTATALTVQQLAAAKKLPPEFLRDRCGLRDEAGGVVIPYWDLGGEIIAEKRRTAVIAKEGSRWPAATPVAAYGLWRLEADREQGYLILVEGESDCWALWHHGFPVLGVPGANTANVLRLEYFAGIGRVYVFREPDKGGDTFAAGVPKRLEEIGYTGKVFELRLDGVKDPADLQATEGWRFRPQLQRALEAAEALPRPDLNGHTSGKGPARAKAPPVTFPQPIPASRLQPGDDRPWLWHGILARESITLFSALWKAGKTTLLAHLLKALEAPGTFCGLDIVPGKVLYVTEENEGRWAERCQHLALQDHVEFLVRPLPGKPDWPTWTLFLAHLKALREQAHYDLVVLDPLTNLWPVRDENDAPQVQEALMPLHAILKGSCGLLVHHNRKSDGQEATAARGSGALSAFVDTILELRRYQSNDKKDRRRVLTGYGRYEQTPDEVVVELTEGGYVAHGDRKQVSTVELANVLLVLLPREAPGWTVPEICAEWPTGSSPMRERLLAALHHGTETGLWLQEGEGKRGSPHRFWRPL